MVERKPFGVMTLVLVLDIHVGKVRTGILLLLNEKYTMGKLLL